MRSGVCRSSTDRNHAAATSKVAVFAGCRWTKRGKPKCRVRVTQKVLLLFPQPVAGGASVPNRSQSNYAFKPTAGEVIRTSQPLLAGGGLTRR
jgi:hypothetical protein